MNKIIARKLLNNYAKDMGNYFDFVQGNEEECFSQAIALVKQANLFQKFKLLFSK